MKPSSKYFSYKKRIRIIFAVAAVILISAAAFGLLCGSVKISFSDILSAAKNGACGAKERIFIYSRLPRTLSSLFAGAALAVSGAVIQNVLSNRLASPGIIGVNSGAGLAVTLCSAVGVFGGWLLSFYSFLGAFFACIIIAAGSYKFSSSKGSVILMGVALNSILSALSDAVIEFKPEIAVMSADFRIGDFSGATYKKLLPAMIIVFLSLSAVFFLSTRLDVLCLGDERAQSLGLNTKISRVVFLLIASLLAGCAVSVAGLLSFVGLIIPHAVRKLGIDLSKHLLPLCALFGAGFVTLCDTVAKSAFSPYEVPVGIIMSFVGAPVFVFILLKGGKKNAGSDI